MRREGWVRAIASLVPTTMVIVACSSAYSEGENTPGGGDSDAATDGPTSVEAPPLACDPEEAPPVNAVYVSATAGNDSSGNGMASAPLASITAGLARAAANGAKDVVVGTGSYVENVKIGDAHVGMKLHGGWIFVPASVSWKRDCAAGPNAVSIRANGRAIECAVSAVNEEITLRNLTVESTGFDDTVPGSGRAGSSIALFVAKACALRLEGVKLIAARGADGTTPVVHGQSGMGTCNQTTDCSAAAPPVGGTGNAGANGAPRFTAAGWDPTVATKGDVGGNGGNGKVGGDPTSATCKNCLGGGLQCSSPAPPNETGTGTKGRCGCRGLGGLGGDPGVAGGASVGLVVAESAAVTLKSVALTTVGGGNGAAGAAGGAGGGGGPGLAGQTYPCATTCKYDGAGVCMDNSVSFIGAGMAGGDGSAGGPGGKGGGGAGGASIGIVKVGGARTTVIDGVVFAVGPGGTGGDGAAAGPSQQTLDAP